MLFELMPLTSSANVSILNYSNPIFYFIFHECFIDKPITRTRLTPIPFTAANHIPKLPPWFPIKTPTNTSTSKRVSKDSTSIDVSIPYISQRTSTPYNIHYVNMEFKSGGKPGTNYTDIAVKTCLGILAALIAAAVVIACIVKRKNSKDPSLVEEKENNDVRKFSII